VCLIKKDDNYKVEPSLYKSRGGTSEVSLRVTSH
jgi:hypothetical protein